MTISSHTFSTAHFSASCNNKTHCYILVHRLPQPEIWPPLPACEVFTQDYESDNRHPRQACLRLCPAGQRKNIAEGHCDLSSGGEGRRVRERYEERWRSGGEAETHTHTHLGTTHQCAATRQHLSTKAAQRGLTTPDVQQTTLTASTS